MKTFIIFSILFSSLISYATEVPNEVDCSVNKYETVATGNVELSSHKLNFLRSEIVQGGRYKSAGDYENIDVALSVEVQNYGSGQEIHINLSETNEALTAVTTLSGQHLSENQITSFLYRKPHTDKFLFVVCVKK
jgi:hypothetical protein